MPAMSAARLYTSRTSRVASRQALGRQASDQVVALEAMAVGTTVLVNWHSEVLVEHVRKNHAALWYDNRDERPCRLRLSTTGPGESRDESYRESRRAGLLTQATAACS